MKKVRKPCISSPGRTDKFPPPLMRFLRSKSSRRRSRASPMFFRRKNTVIETTQEPSSPKVTCFGQVRVRRSNKTTAVATRRRNRLCRCLGKLKPSKWVSFFRCGYCCKQTTDSAAVDGFPTRNDVAGEDGEECEKGENVQRIEEEEEEEGDKDNNNNGINEEGLISKSPPRNALLLTRCRSAPYRSSSLASRLWEKTETGDDDNEEEEEVVEKIKNLKINNSNEKEKVENGENEEEEEELKGRPLMMKKNVLSRCKSEPATTWDRLLLPLSL